MNPIKDLASFADNIKEYLDTYDCHYVYVSLGSKYNEQTVHFQCPKKTQYSNALNQMIPNFTYSLSCEKNTLLIVIDDFHDSKSLLQNQQRLLLISKDFPQMNIFLFDYIITLQNVDQLINMLMNTVSMKIHPEQFMICNYICFKNPNLQDFQLEQQLPPTIHILLNKFQGGEYKKCFHQWYGYTYYTYHYVYNYEAYRHLYMFHISPIFHLLDKTLNDSLDDFNIEIVDLFIKRHPQNSEKWNQFKQHSLSIL
jgi:hypothetical protein